MRMASKLSVGRIAMRQTNRLITPWNRPLLFGLSCCGFWVTLDPAGVVHESPARAAVAGVPVQDTEQAGERESRARELGSLLESGSLEERRDASYELAQLGAQAWPALDQLIEGLSDRDRQIWANSIQAISQLGPRGLPARDSLIEGLSDRDLQRWYRSAVTLGKLGPQTLDQLVELLESSNPRTRAGAAKALGWIRPKPIQAAEPLVARLADSDELVRQSTADALVMLGPETYPALDSSLNEAEAQHQVAILEVFTKIGKPAPSLVPALLQRFHNSDSADLKAAGLLAMSRLGPTHRDVLTVLVDEAASDKVEVREAAIQGLIFVGPAIQPVLPRLLERLAAEDAMVRSSAAFAIGQLGQSGAAAVPALIAAIHQFQEGPESSLVRAISQIGPQAVPDLLRAVRDQQFSPEHLAAVLSGMGLRAVAPLKLALGHADAAVRAGAAGALGAIDPLDDETFTALLGTCQDPEASVRVSALRAVGELGDAKGRAVVEQGLADGDPQVRRTALVAFSQLPVPTKEKVNAILAALEDSDEPSRAAAARALGQLGPIAKVYAAKIVGLLDSKTLEHRIDAVVALGRIHADQPEIVARLGQLLNDSRLAVPAAEALVAVGAAAKPAQADLINALTSTNRAVRPLVMQALGQIGPDARPAIPLLREAVRDAEPSARAQAVEALVRIESNLDALIPTLIETLDDADWTVRKQATVALGSLEAKAIAAVPRLFQLLASEEDVDAAREALKKIDTADEQAIPVLIEGLESPDRRVQFYAVFLLGKIGPAAKDALPELKKLGRDSSPRFREMLSATIKKIEG